MKLINASILSCLLLTGCGVAGALEAPEPETKVASPAPRVVGECLTASPSWEKVPERRMTFKELKDLWDVNRRSFEDMAAARRICRAGLKARGA